MAVAPQLFPTPPDLARRMVEEAGIAGAVRILEPSAGTGNVLRAIQEEAGTLATTTAVEIDARLARTGYGSQELRVVVGDFLEQTPERLGSFDRIVMNPPFANADDVRHVVHALAFLSRGGRLVAICAGGPRQERELRPLASLWEPLPARTFRDSGTDANTVLLVIDGPRRTIMVIVSEETPKSRPKQPGPDFQMRLGEEKAEWQAAATEEGIDQLGTWIKKVVRDHLKKQRRKKAQDK